MAENTTDQTQLEWECDECAAYIMNRINDMAEINPMICTEFEENLSMWMHDHFSKED